MILQNRTCADCMASFVPKWKEQIRCDVCIDKLLGEREDKETKKKEVKNNGRTNKSK